MILIGLGANLPTASGMQPADTLMAALKALGRQGVALEALSSLIRTKPVPVSDQPDYLNAVARLRTGLSTEALLDLLQAVERQFGRIRKNLNEARELDLDLLVFRDRVQPEHGWPDAPGPEGLILPHPRMHLRAFVLGPLREIAPQWVHPVLGLTVDELLDRL